MPTVAEIFMSMEYGPAPESPSPALDWIQAHDGTFSHHIGGETNPPSAVFPVYRPDTGELLAHCAAGSPEEIDQAAAAAAAAQPGWAGLTPHTRAKHLYAIARAIQRHARLFAVLESLDNGKPIRETRDIDIPLAARHFYHHAGWAQILPEAFPNFSPIGVIGQIIPWNFPLLMLAWKVAPALAAGNTVVLKPAEDTPLTALLFAEIAQSCGLPAGVVNVVTGDGTTGQALVQHPKVQKIAFTGSTEVGRQLRRMTAGTGKHLSLELGGKSPFIVFEDADLDSVVEGIVDAIWFNQGQVCCAGSRLLAQENISDRLLQRLKRRMETLRTGPSLDKAIDIGAVISPVQLERISRLVQQGVQEGAVLWQPSWKVPSEGCYYPPTLLTEVEPACTVAQEEIFGPVLACTTFRTPAEAVELANNSRYGLAASVWSENINVALDIAPRLKAGTVWINCTNLFDAASGFGGVRESGFGREGGREGMLEYLRPVLRTPLEPMGQNQATVHETHGSSGVGVDRTAKLYIGGRQVRPDGGLSITATGADGRPLGDYPLANRKDVRNAVEAAHAAAAAWRSASAHYRAQILYYTAENLAQRRAEFAERLTAMTGEDGDRELDICLERLFYWAAWADKDDGAVHAAPFRNITLAMREPIGVVGAAAPSSPPLLGLISIAAPLIALGNTAVIIGSSAYPLAVTDLYQVLETSDLPGGVINLLTGDRNELAQVLAAHHDVEGMWYWGTEEGVRMVETESAANLKRTWCEKDGLRNWFGEDGQGEWFRHQAVQIKNIWVPYGA
jgi:aldehyde dehydrogenase (NAD+)